MWQSVKPSERLVEEIFRAAKERNRVLSDDEVLEICKFARAESQEPIHLDTLTTWKKTIESV